MKLFRIIEGMKSPRNELSFQTYVGHVIQVHQLHRIVQGMNYLFKFEAALQESVNCIHMWCTYDASKDDAVNYSFTYLNVQSLSAE